MAMADVTVLGAGIFGLSVAWACVQRGARVRVIDPHGPGAGSSGGIVGALAPHVPEQWNDKKAFQFDSLMMAGDFWQEVEAASGLSTGYARLGRLQPVADEAALDLARIRALSATELWQGHAVWEVLRADEGGDWMPASPSGWVIRDTLTARLHPRMACAALVDALRARGAEVVADHARQGAVVHATGAAGLGSGDCPRPCSRACAARCRHPRALGRCAPKVAQSRPCSGRAPCLQGSVHRQWWLQDRFRHGAQGGAGHGRSCAGRG